MNETLSYFSQKRGPFLLRPWEVAVVRYKLFFFAQERNRKIIYRGVTQQRSTYARITARGIYESNYSMRTRTEAIFQLCLQEQ